MSDRPQWSRDDGGPGTGGWISGACSASAPEPLVLVESRAATAEMDERCFSFSVGMLRTHRTAEARPGDVTPLCACGRVALGCEVNSALRAAKLLDPLDLTPEPAPSPGDERGSPGPAAAGQ